MRPAGLQTSCSGSALGTLTCRRSYAGSTIGRYANRIAQGRFKLDGPSYCALSRNQGDNHFHGSFRGFDKMLWRSEVDEAACAVRFVYRSQDGEG